MQVDNDASALAYLKRIGYYRLSGYWYPMRQIDRNSLARQKAPVRSDRFLPGSRFEDAVRLYVFDKKLRLLALDALERIEMAIRVDVAYTLGKRAPHAHEDPKHLHGTFTKKKKNGKSPYEDWLKKYREQLRRSQRSTLVSHHNKVYGGLPIWAAIEIWDFGMLSKMYSGMKHEDREQIAQAYGANDSKTLSQWLKSLNFIRNTCAHHGRLWNINILELSNVPEAWEPFKLNKARPFFYFCLMQQLLQNICPNSTWSQRFQNLLQEFPEPENKAITLRDLGTVPAWQTIPVWEKAEAQKKTAAYPPEGEEATVIFESILHESTPAVKPNMPEASSDADNRPPEPQ
ncbi:MAG: Abi family protein [Lautropia sp.]|nr:Abi family protein [Lautropia sp.]